MGKGRQALCLPIAHLLHCCVAHLGSGITPTTVSTSSGFGGRQSCSARGSAFFSGQHACSLAGLLFFSAAGVGGQAAERLGREKLDSQVLTLS